MKTIRFFSVLLCLGLALPFAAQEGHPMSGTWSGEWGPPKGDQNHTTLILSWDGNAVSGLVDPGPDSAKIRVANLDTTKWTVRLEYDLKDKSGKPVPFIVEGRLQNASSRKDRTITGTFTHGAVKGNFKVKLDI